MLQASQRCCYYKASRWACSLKHKWEMVHCSLLIQRVELRKFLLLDLCLLIALQTAAFAYLL